MNHAKLALLAIVCASAWCGCTRDAKSKSDGDKRTTVAAGEIRLLVIDDPSLAAAAESLRAEWKARTGGGTLMVEQMPLAEALAKSSPPGNPDAIIYPSSLLGPLAEGEWIAPLPADFAKNQTLAWGDTFELLQVGECLWGPQAYAVPFGSPQLTCFYRRDLLERLRRKPPETWTEYHELAELLNRSSSESEGASQGWHGSLEPLSSGWAGRTLLARAAAYAKHRGNYSTLFHIDTMDALVGGPPFVRALGELVADAKLGLSDGRALDVDGVRVEFLAGRCGLALAWPGRPRGEAAHADESRVDFGCIELPGSRRAFDVSNQTWDDRGAEEESRVSLLGLAGRLGSIGRGARRADEALQLLAWLSGAEWGAKASAASTATTIYRGSQKGSPQPWLDSAFDAGVAQQYVNSVRDALSRSAFLFALRLDGQERYLGALDQAVEQAVRGTASPADALRLAATSWNEITDEIGRGPQRRAYRLSLGLEP